MAAARRVAPGLADSIAILGRCSLFFGLILDPKLGPDRLKNSKFWYQYIYFYFSPKVRNQYIYFAPIFFNILVPDFETILTVMTL